MNRPSTLLIIMLALCFQAAARSAEEYSLVPLPNPTSQRDPQALATEPVLPKEIPQAFAELLNPRGVRLKSSDGEPIHDLWFRRSVSVSGAESTSMSVRFAQLELGTYIGVLRSHGVASDYQENFIDKGSYLLRYGMRPDNGDHMGTSESRDLRLLTRFEDDQAVGPVKEMDRLIDLAMAASSVGHPLTLFLEPPERTPVDSAAAEEGREDRESFVAPRLLRHSRRDEWIAEVQLAECRSGKEKSAAASLRLGIGLIGMSASF